MGTGFNLNDISAKLQQLQTQFDQLAQIQQNIQGAASITEPRSPISTYPKVVRTDTVEDILNNPQWEKELANEFAASDLGIKAKQNTELLFMEFCENQTGKTSSKLAALRKEIQTTKKSKIPAQDSIKG